MPKRRKKLESTENSLKIFILTVLLLCQPLNCVQSPGVQNENEHPDPDSPEDLKYPENLNEILQRPDLPDIKNFDQATFMNHDYNFQRYSWTLQTYNQYQYEASHPKIRISNEEWQTDIELTYRLMKENLCSSKKKDMIISLYPKSGSKVKEDLKVSLAPSFYCESRTQTQEHLRQLEYFKPELIKHFTSSRGLNANKKKKTFKDPENYPFAMNPLLVLQEMVNYFKYCPENENYTLISNETLLELFQIIIYQFGESVPDEIYNFNFNRMPCCRIMPKESTIVDTWIIELIKYKFPYNADTFFEDIETPETQHLFEVLRFIEEKIGKDLQLEEVARKLPRTYGELDPYAIFKNEKLLSLIIKHTGMDKKTLEHEIDEALVRIAKNENKTPNEKFSSIRTHVQHTSHLHIEESLVYLISGGLYELREVGTTLGWSTLSDSFLNLALKWKADGYLGESLQCFRSALNMNLIDEIDDAFSPHHTQSDNFKSGQRSGPQQLSLSSVNALGMLARTAYFYDESENLKITKALVNATLDAVYTAYTEITKHGDPSSPSAANYLTQEQYIKLQIFEAVELGNGSPGMCLGIYTLFDLVTQSEVQVVKNAKRELEWENQVHLDKIGFHFLRWLRDIWQKKCQIFEAPLNKRQIGLYRSQKGVQIYGSSGLMEGPKLSPDDVVVTVIDKIISDDSGQDFMTSIFNMWFDLMEYYTTPRSRYQILGKDPNWKYIMFVIGALMIMFCFLPGEDEEQAVRVNLNSSSNNRNRVRKEFVNSPPRRGGRSERNGYVIRPAATGVN